jgi:LysM repeat protein
MKTCTRVSTCLLSLAIVLLWGCAKEGARTDIELEMTDEDSVEAIIDQDLLTVGGTIVNIDESAGTRGSQSTVTYVDEVEMQRPVLVEPDDSLRPPGMADESVTTMIVTDESLLPPPVEATAIEPPVFETTFEPDTSLAAEAAEPAMPAELTEPSLPDVDTLLDQAAATETPPLAMADDEDLVPPPSPLEQPGDGGTTPGGIQPGAVRPPGGGYYSTPYAKMSPPVVYPRHTVVQGDTLWSISKKYNVSISELCAANNVSRRDILSIGQTLVIPRTPTGEAAPPPSEAAPPATVTPTPEPVTPAPDVTAMETEYYTVQQGDSYWKIARQYGISASELMALNDTSDTIIRVGQKILVPQK